MLLVLEFFSVSSKTLKLVFKQPQHTLLGSCDLGDRMGHLQIVRLVVQMPLHP